MAAGWPPPTELSSSGACLFRGTKGTGRMGVKPLQEDITRPIPKSACRQLQVSHATAWKPCAPLKRGIPFGGQVPPCQQPVVWPADRPKDHQTAVRLSQSTTKATTGRFRPANSPSDLCQRLLVDGFVHGAAHLGAPCIPNQSVCTRKGLRPDEQSVHSQMEALLTNTNNCDIRSAGINHIKGAFLHSAGTAPIITLFIPGTPLKTTHPQKDA